MLSLKLPLCHINEHIKITIGFIPLWQSSWEVKHLLKHNVFQNSTSSCSIYNSYIAAVEVKIFVKCRVFQCYLIDVMMQVMHPKSELVSSQSKHKSWTSCIASKLSGWYSFLLTESALLRVLYTLACGCYLGL